MSIDQRIVKATEQLEADVKITSDVTHGDANTQIPSPGGPIPSLRKRLKDIETEWAKTADPLAEDLASAVKLTREYSEEARRVLEEAVHIHVLSMAINLIKTQTLVIQHHAFR